MLAIQDDSAGKALPNLCLLLEAGHLVWLSRPKRSLTQPLQ